MDPLFKVNGGRDTRKRKVFRKRHQREGGKLLPGTKKTVPGRVSIKRRLVKTPFAFFLAGKA